jgi:hypothetical protein
MPMIIGFSRILLRIFASECGSAVAKPAGDFFNSFIHRNKYVPLSKRLTLRRRSNVIVSSRSSKGRDLETHLDTERVRFLRAAPLDSKKHH